MFELISWCFKEVSTVPYMMMHTLTYVTVVLSELVFSLFMTLLLTKQCINVSFVRQPHKHVCSRKWRTQWRSWKLNWLLCWRPSKLQNGAPCWTMQNRQLWTSWRIQHGGDPETRPLRRDWSLTLNAEMRWKRILLRIRRINCIMFSPNNFYSPERRSMVMVCIYPLQNHW